MDQEQANKQQHAPAGETHGKKGIIPTIPHDPGVGQTFFLQIKNPPRRSLSSFHFEIPLTLGVVSNYTFLFFGIPGWLRNVRRLSPPKLIKCENLAPLY